MAQSAVNQYQAIERSLDRELSKYPAMLQLERRTGFKKTNIVFLTLGALLTLLLLNYMAEIVLALIAFVYPAIMTVSAIESHDKKMDTHWLAYWLVLGLLNTFETVTSGVIAKLVPFYSIVKLILCLWLFLPTTGGAMMMYERIIRPIALFIREHPTIKEVSRDASKAAGKVTQDARMAARDARNAAQEITSMKGSSTSKLTEEIKGE